VHDKPLPYCYIVVRKDLQSSAYKAVQAAHAVLQAARQGLVQSLAHPVLVIVEVDDELELLRFAANLQNQSIRNVVFYEDDIESYSALATECVTGKQRKVFRKMRLLE